MGGIHSFLDSYLRVCFSDKLDGISIGIWIENNHSFRVLAKIVRIYAMLENVLCERILVWVDVGVVERFLALRNSQEPDGEQIGFFGECFL